MFLLPMPFTIATHASKIKFFYSPRRENISVINLLRKLVQLKTYANATIIKKLMSVMTSMMICLRGVICSRKGTSERRRMQFSIIEILNHDG